MRRETGVARSRARSARSAADPQAATSALRQAIHDLAPAVPLHDVHTLEAAVAESLGTERLTNQLLVGFALTALALAALGIYGVLTLSVGRRTSEFGIRMALGATPAAVVGLVVRQGSRLVVAGLALGLVASGALSRTIASLLFGVKPLDPWTFALVPLGLGALALLACWLPARRASAADPLAAPRSE